MPRTFLEADHHRQIIGNYTYQQDNKQGGQRQQDERIKLLASTPGLHSENSSRQSFAQAIVRFLSLLTAASNSTVSTATTLNGTELQSFTPRSVTFAPQNVTANINTVNQHEGEGKPTTVVASVTPRTRMKKIKNPTKKPIPQQQKKTVNNEGGNERLILFFKKEGVFTCNKTHCEVSKEQLVSGVLHWLYDVDVEGDIIPLHRMETVARHILRSSGDYGGQNSEHLSREQVARVIRHWVFETVLGVMLSEYLTRQMATATHPDYFTVSSIEHLVALDTLDSKKHFSAERVPMEWQSDLNAAWPLLLRQELPLLGLTDRTTDEMLLTSPAFGHLYTGTRFLSDVGQLHKFSREESSKIGEALWLMALHDGVSADKMSYFLLPALFSAAEKKPQNISAEKKLRSISAEVIIDYIESQKENEAVRQRLVTQLQHYQSAANQWLSKGQLAEKIIAGCPPLELPTLDDRADAIRTPQQRREKAQGQSKQLYMNGVLKPCQAAPDNLNDAYHRLTKQVSDSFREVDKSLIRYALEGMDDDEAKFISSPNATIYPTYFSMNTRRGMIMAYNVAVDKNVYVNLKKTDLFSVNINEQERIYALKQEERDGFRGYSITRVDRDIFRYIQADVLDYKDFGTNRVFNDRKLITDKDTFHITIFTDKKNPFENGEGKSKIINPLSDIHSEAVYHSLYTAGNDASELQKTWEIVKHIIPFYDCIDGIINNNPEQAVPACMMDVLVIAPVLSQAARLGGKFGLGLGKTAYNTGKILRAGEKIRSADVLLKDIAVPTLLEMTSLGKSTLRSLDPGFELITGIGRGFIEKLVAFLNKDIKTRALAEKLVSGNWLEKLPAPSSSVISARLPYSQVSVPVERISRGSHQGVYVLANPETGVLAGKRFLLSHDNQLIPLHRQNVIPQHLTLNTQIPELKDTHILYNIPRRSIEGNDRIRRVQLDNDDPVVQIGVSPLADFLPPKFGYAPENRVDVDFSVYQRNVLENYFPEQWQNIIAAKTEMSHVYIHSVADGFESIPEQFYFLRENLWYFTTAINDAKTISNNVKNKVNDVYFSTGERQADSDFHERIISDYMEEVLAVDEPEIIGAAVERLRHYLGKICDHFDNHYSDIYLATARQSGMRYAETQGALGFTHCLDADRRVMILADRFINSELLNNALHLTALHEVSHTAGGTRDFFSSPYTSRVGEPEDIPEAFEDQLTGRDQTNVLQFDDDFLDAYAHRVGIQRPDIERFKQLILNDDMLRANIIMDNADTLATIINDLHERLFPSRMQRDARQSAVQSNISKGMIKKALLSLTTVVSESSKEA